MKSVDLFCASPASTAVCSSMDQRSMVRQGGIRHIDNQQRHSHRLGDHHHRHKTKTKTPIIPCSSQIPISPKPFVDKFRKSATSSSSTPRLSLEFLRRKSSADISDLSSPPAPSGSSSSRYLLSDTPLLIDFLSSSDDSQHSSSTTMVVPRQPLRSIASKKQHNFKDYPVFRSSLSAHSYDNPVFESSSPSLCPSVDLQAQKTSLSRFNHAQKSPSLSRVHDDSHVQKSSLSRTSASHASKSSLAFTDESHALNKSGRPRDQVVELRVSIHCKGCEGKIRKHISRMEGVTSFSIDLATKKVTVIGNVTPLGVLTSISKVKNAEFWPSPTSSSTSSSSPTPSTTTTTGMIIVSN